MILGSETMTHLGGAAICVIMSSSCTSSRSGITGISELEIIYIIELLKEQCRDVLVIILLL